MALFFHASSISCIPDHCPSASGVWDNRLRLLGSQHWGVSCPSYQACLWHLAVLMPAFQYSGNPGLAKSFLHQMWPCTPQVGRGRNCPCAPTASLRGSQEKGTFLHQVNPLKPGGTVKKLCREKMETQSGKPVATFPKCGMQLVHQFQGLARPRWEPIQVLRETTGTIRMSSEHKAR